MKNSILKSIGAILAGFFVGALLSVGTDFLLNLTGIMSMQNFRSNSSWVVLAVIFYRFIFNVTGSYMTAKLAPSKPMRHALILGFTGTVLASVGSLIMWEQAVPWYNISIILISLPGAWLGGKLFISKNI